ncbi:hypothetical protein XELAEV_18011314mg, partial [Xenopus laevis]
MTPVTHNKQGCTYTYHTLTLLQVVNYSQEDPHSCRTHAGGGAAQPGPVYNPTREAADTQGVRLAGTSPLIRTLPRLTRVTPSPATIRANPAASPEPENDIHQPGDAASPARSAVPADSTSERDSATCWSRERTAPLLLPVA